MDEHSGGERCRTPHTHGGTDAPECTPCGTRCQPTHTHKRAVVIDPEDREQVELLYRVLVPIDIPNPTPARIDLCQQALRTLTVSHGASLTPPAPTSERGA